VRQSAEHHNHEQRIGGMIEQSTERGCVIESARYQPVEEIGGYGQNEQTRSPRPAVRDHGVGTRADAGEPHTSEEISPGEPHARGILREGRRSVACPIRRQCEAAMRIES